MCRFQFNASQAEICTEVNVIFDQDALCVINEWLEQCWSDIDKRTLLKQNKRENIRISNCSVHKEEIKILNNQLEECRH
jgi:hypothetical protein